LTVLSFGCAGPGVRADPRADGAALPSIHHIVGVPFVPGEPGACGPATLASILGYVGDAVTVEDIAHAIAAPSLAGVLPFDLERYASARGLHATVRTAVGSLAWLRQRVASDHPVVAFLDLGIGPLRQGHFVVVVGYDDAARQVLLYSGRDPNASMSYRRFTAAWQRTDWWALTLEPPTGGALDGSPAS
jgi:ABC-type bacteriocin/lantibiotic exporter with double-glycine peptidase domain